MGKIKNSFFYVRAHARVPYLEYFSKKNQLSYLEYFSKVNFEKNLTLVIFNFDFLDFDFENFQLHYFLIFKCARMYHASTFILRIFFKKSTLKKILPYKFF